MDQSQILAAQVDQLGYLLAQIDVLTKQANLIKDALKDQATLPGGSKVIEGNLFRSTIVSADRELFDSKKFIAVHGEAAYKQYTKISASFSVRTTSK